NRRVEKLDSTATRSIQSRNLAGAGHTCCQIVLEFGKPRCAVASIVDADLVVAQSGNRDLSVDRPD
ncbi:hypothetical protein P0D88_52810, partial [Paraburkholderia sp. RL18-103-BIB-C]|uniref:hypothetical protein n=1 Tax=unclassified Paraburkholderia TaxID=2615204 RepID=UPI0038B7B81C